MDKQTDDGLVGIKIKRKSNIETMVASVTVIALKSANRPSTL